MDRRNFLRGVAAGSAMLAIPAWARADETRDAYLASLAGNPRLAALKGATADISAAAAIEGRWLAELRGTFYRNGPARLELGGERYHHWFDGDGMAQAWHIGGGSVQHEGHFIRTQKYVEESAAGQFLYSAFDTDVQRRHLANNDTANAANTNLVPHAGKLYALWEGGSATELDSARLSTRGIKTWRDDLAAMPFSAHPKITPDGVLWNFGVVPGADKLLLWRVDANGALGKFGMIDVPQLAMVHDFIVTARYMVFLVPPIDLHRGDHTTYLGAHVWNGNRPMRAVVVDRADFTLRRIVEMPAGMAIHLGNGWDEGDTIRLDACVAADDSGIRGLGAVMHGETIHRAEPDTVLITLNLTRGVARSETLLRRTEFPRVASADIGKRYRQLFVTTKDKATQFGMTGIARIDVESGRTDRFEYGLDWIAEEHIPVAKASGKGQWLLGTAYDVRKQQTVISVFDGAHLAQGPVARARLPYAAPLCFHGNFLAA